MLILPLINKKEKLSILKIIAKIHFLCRTATSFVIREGTSFYTSNRGFKAKYEGGVTMKTRLKTKEVSQLLEVNPTTVQRWIKFFKLPCEKNEHGHYLFDDTNILQLKEIKSQLNLGLPMTQVKVTHLNNNDSKTHQDGKNSTHSQEDVLNKIDNITKRIEEVEYKLQEKATNVVNIQLLQHRRELEKIYTLVENLRNEIDQLKTVQQAKKENINDSYNHKQKPNRNWFASLLNMN